MSILVKFARLLSLIVCIFMTISHAGASKPNIVVYISDDHSQVDSSLYGNPDIPTPGFEKLAKDGMTFTHAFVASPACAPSRAAMLTGLMPARNGAEANHTQPRKNIRILVKDLQAAGYEVAAVGKVAHGQNLKPYGFDHIGNGRRLDQYRGGVPRYLANRKTKKPLCLFVGTTHPHVPWTSKRTFDPAKVVFPPHHLDTPLTREHRAAYYQEIKELDVFLDDLRKMAAKHLGENVLFIHTSDHGSQWPFGKWNLYDYGIRVPFIATWPGVIKKGTTSNAMISWIDLMPTLIEIAGGKVPDGLDGKSFLDVLKGSKKNHRDYIFTTTTGDGRKNVFPMRSIRSREWKLVYNLHPEFAHTNHSDLDRKPMAGAYWNEWAKVIKTDKAAAAIVDRYYKRPMYELFHVADDKWELKNLAADPAHAKKLEELKTKLEAWMKSQNDKRLINAEPRLLSNKKDWHPDYYKPTPPQPKNQNK